MSKQNLIAIVLLAALPGLALAGGRATFVGSSPQSSADGTFTIVWEDENMLRMNMGQQDAYFILRDGKAYSVTMRNGKATVMDMGVMTGLIGAMAKGASKGNKTPFKKPDDIKPTGQSETVAGVEGQVYIMKMTDGDGNTKTQEVVLTGDPLVVE